MIVGKCKADHDLLFNFKEPKSEIVLCTAALFPVCLIANVYNSKVYHFLSVNVHI